MAIMALAIAIAVAMQPRSQSPSSYHPPWGERGGGKMRDPANEVDGNGDNSNNIFILVTREWLPIFPSWGLNKLKTSTQVQN